MSQTQADRLLAERKQAENQFDITQYEHVPRRYYGRILFATLIVVALIGLVGPSPMARSNGRTSASSSPPSRS